MERDLKFRAWDTIKKIFVPQGEIIFLDYGDTRTEVNPNCMEYIGDPCHNGEPNRSRFKISQYAGLNDRNGGDVYENDIITTASGDIYLVAFRYNAFVVVHTPSTGSKIEGEPKFDFISEFIKKFGIEIIGNVYKTPELLNTGA